MQKSKSILLHFSVSILVLISILTFVFSGIKNSNNFVLADFETETNHHSYVLIDKNSKKVLCEDKANDHFQIASVTKLMTTLIVLERLKNNEFSLDDYITVSQNASGMGGSQVFLDANENYKIAELLKSVIIASANDSSVALAEFIAGSENNFVRLMNEKASELGLSNTHYVNCTGLPNDSAYSSAYDQAIVLSNVLDYDVYQQFSHIWMEDFVHPSGRTTQMTNTNKLSRFYDGCLGGKTGFTNQAKSCLAVGAERADTQLIAVVLGADSSKERFALASNLLNYGFNNFQSQTIFDENNLKEIEIAVKNSDEKVKVRADKSYSILTDKNTETNYSVVLNLPDVLTESTAGEVIGNAEIYVDGVLVDTINIRALNSVKQSTLWDRIKEIVKN